jgi:aryl-alcohol dehydrogenase-like predicted oxidoreductase
MPSYDRLAGNPTSGIAAPPRRRDNDPPRRKPCRDPRRAPADPATAAPSLHDREGRIMDYVTLGRTGLRVGVAGLGCGGFSRLGLGTGGTEADAVRVVRTALDLGVNLIDTAAAYGTEDAVGAAIADVPRDSVVIATKAHANRGKDPVPVEAVLASLHDSLRKLRTDYIDIFQLHGVLPSTYDHATEIVLPALLRERAAGRIRHIGLTESPPSDPTHEMLLRAVENDGWETAMLAFHMMNQNTREALFPRTIARRVGTLLMFAVRRIFARPDLLAETMAELDAAGQLPPGVDRADPLGFLLHPGGATSLTDAAYRFVRHEPGVDVVLFGTGNPDHVRANVESLLAPPLPQADRDRLAALFGHLVGIGLDRPSAARAQAAAKGST